MSEITVFKTDEVYRLRKSYYKTYCRSNYKKVKTLVNFSCSIPYGRSRGSLRIQAFNSGDTFGLGKISKRSHYYPTDINDFLPNENRLKSLTLPIYPQALLETQLST